MEIERKWLFDMSKVPTHLSATLTIYEQAYLSVEPEVRIRKKSVERNMKYPLNENVACKSESYALCIKGNGTISRIEVQKKLEENEFNELSEVGNLTEDKFIHKQYYTINLDGYLLTVGQVDEGKDYSFAYGEIEFASEEEANGFIPPDWFGKEVTADSSYKMKNYWRATRG